LTTLRNAVHFLILDYVRKSGDLKRVEAEERRKDMESEFAMKTTQYSQQSASDLAAIERKRRRAAEREMEKTLRGEP
jgi:prophage antirepressor-like protein